VELTAEPNDVLLPLSGCNGVEFDIVQLRLCGPNRWSFSLSGLGIGVGDRVRL